MQNSISPLEHYEFIRVSGADTLRFLQGQLSCNTEHLTAQRSLTGALCNLKGRVIADFRLVAQGDDCLMQCAEHMAGPILTTLSKYAVFSKVTLEQLDDSERPQVLGLTGSSVDSALEVLDLSLPADPDTVAAGESCKAIRLPGPGSRVELWFTHASAKEEFLSSASFETSTTLDAWQRADIESGIIHVTPELSEEYTPQLLNYDISGLIDFKKGCYTGQEIVARMYYRGTAKKRLYLLSSSAAVSTDSRIGTEGDSEAEGFEILRFDNCDEPALLLAVLPSETVESGQRLQLSDQGSAELQVRNLPYANA